MGLSQEKEIIPPEEIIKSKSDNKIGEIVERELEKTAEAVEKAALEKEKDETGDSKELKIREAKVVPFEKSVQEGKPVVENVRVTEKSLSELENDLTKIIEKLETGDLENSFEYKETIQQIANILTEGEISEGKITEKILEVATHISGKDTGTFAFLLTELNRATNHIITRRGI